MLRVVFGFSEHQDKETYGLGYEKLLTRNINNAVLNKAEAITIGKTVASNMDLYVPPYTFGVEQ